MASSTSTSTRHAGVADHAELDASETRGTKRRKRLTGLTDVAGDNEVATFE